MTRPGIGLVGLGRWGRNYLKTLLALPECRFVAAADLDEAARARIAGETAIVVRESAEELLSDPAVEAVVIATPDRTHYRLAATSLAVGRDVMVEKPMALEPSEAAALAEQAETCGRVLAVGHTAVYHPAFASLIDEIRTKPFAQRQASAIRTSSGYADGRSNPILDLCPHDIALAVLLFGTPVAARASLNGNGVEYEVRFPGDALLTGYAEWREPPHVRRFEVAGAQNTLGDKEGSRGSHVTRETPLGRQCLDFIECCRTRRRPLSSGWLGLAVVRCLSAVAISSADSNTWVQIKTDPRMPGSGLRRSESGVRT
jgi:predicted dehydrogenase